MADVTELMAEQEREEVPTFVPIVRENGTPYPGEPTVIQVVGLYSRRVTEAEDREALLARRARPLRITRAAAAIVGWSGVVSRGVSVPFTFSTAAKLLTAAPWILAQVEAAMKPSVATRATQKAA